MTATERLHGLDSLRAVAMLLGIVLHAAVPFMTIRTLWIVHDAYPDTGFDTLVGVIHGFRMQLFYFIAGFFAHLMWKKSGTYGFLLQRGRRIGIPFVVGMLTIIPLGLWLYFWAESLFGPNPDLPEVREPSLLLYPTMHLWFLEILLMLYAVAMLLAQLRHHAFGIKLAQQCDQAFDWLIRQPLKPIVLSLPATACIWSGPTIGEVEAMGTQLLPSLRAVVYFSIFFFTGWWVHRCIHRLNELTRYLKTYLLLAVLAYFAWGTGYTIFAVPGVYGNPEYEYVKLFALFSASLYAWAMLFAITGLFLKFASKHRPWARYLADASYWMYLWHLPLVLWLQVEVVVLPLNAWLKLALILAVNAVVLLATYHYLVRYSWIGRILNGERKKVASFPAAT